MTTRCRLFASRIFLAASIACLSWIGLPASGFPLFESPVPVAEYYNTSLKHYFLTAEPPEMAAIDAGLAGPGWVRTGWSFLAYPSTSPFQCGRVAGCGKPVSRFYGTRGLGPNSHFYTADAAEAAGLERPGSGWSLEGLAFSIDVPGSDGQCAAGLVPVYRLYNRRAIYNDANHRYVTDAGERARMVALGWADEGVRFCAYGASQVPIKSYSIAFTRSPMKVLPGPQCEDEALNRGPCVGVNNLPVPSELYPPTAPHLMPEAFFDRTGMSTSVVHVVPPASAADSPLFSFVQDGGSTIGVNVDTQGRGPRALSNVNPIYQFHTTVDAGTFDDRFFPFGAYESDVQLDVRLTLNVKTIETRSTGSAAYGHPTLEFIDQRSGHHVYFTVLTYGTVAPTDLLSIDSGTGKVIVGTTFRADSPYITSLGLPTLPTPSGFVSPNFWGWGGAFEFRMDRSQFQRVLDSARTLDPALSSSPADYLLDNFHFNNEVYGDGEIGINLAGYTLDVIRR